MREFELALKAVSATDAEKLASIWQYWALQDSEEEVAELPDEGPHPDHFVGF